MMRSIARIAFVVLVFSSLAGSQSALAQRESATPEKLFTSAFASYAEGIYERAVPAFVAFRQKYPDHPSVAEAIYYEAESTLALGREDEAVRLFELFQRRYPLHPLAFPARTALGSYFYRTGAYERAIETFAQVIEDEPPTELGARALYWMGTSALELGQKEQALTYFQRAADEYRMASTAPLALYTIAFTHVKDGNYQAAARAFESLSARYPNTSFSRDAGLAVAEVYFELGDFRRAIEEAESRINGLEGPDRDRAHFLLAESHSQLGDVDQAVLAYRRLTDGDPNSPFYRPALFGLAWNFYKMGNFQWAAEQFQMVRSSGQDELSARATYYEGVNRTLTQEPEPAIALFSEYLDSWPDGSLAEHALYELGVTYYRERRWDEAEETLSSFVDAFPDSPTAGEALNYLGNTYVALNDFDQALDRFEQAIDLDSAPDALKDQIVFQRAWLLYRNQNYEEAAPAFEQIYTNAPEGDRAPDALFWAAESHYQAGRLGEATRLFRNYLRDYSRGQHAEAAQYAIGWVHFRSGRYGEAAQAFERFLDVYRDQNETIPYRTDALLRLADSYYALKRYPEAIRTYARVEEEGGEYTLYQIGQAYSNNGQTGQAIRAFRRLLDEYPRSEWSEEAQYQIGYLYFLTQDYDQAIEQYGEVIATWPRDPLAAKAQYAIGDAHFNAGRMEEAIEAYSVVLERYSGSPFVSDAASSIQYALVTIDDQSSAAEFVDNFAAEHPDSPVVEELRFRQAEVKYQSGRVAEAEGDFRQFLQTSSNERLTSEAVYYLGIISVDRNQFESAETYLNRLLQEFPRSERRTDALRQLGRIYLDRDLYGDALRTYEQMEEAQPGDTRVRSEARYGQSVALIGMGRTDRAESLLRDVTENAPDAPESLAAFLGLARLSENQGRTGEAIRLYREVVGRSRDEIGAEALFRLGSLLLSRGDARAAIGEFSRLPVLFSGYSNWVAESYLGQARANQQLGNAGDAVRLYDRVISEFAGTPYAEAAEREKAAL